MTRPKSKKTFFLKKRHTMFFLFFVLFVLSVVLIVREIQTSRFQAWYFHRIAKKFTYPVEQGLSHAIRFPAYGPYDVRLGYDRIPKWAGKMRQQGYDVTAQARWSQDLIKYTDKGIFPIYKEKTQAGLFIQDSHEQEIMRVNFPERIYKQFEDIPPVLIRMLLFIENRVLLKPSSVYGNPAIEWKRQLKALTDITVHLFDKSHHVAGGSTLATQIEKFRHSPDGITLDFTEKLKQIISASFRSYLAGEKTHNIRKQIVLDYINSIPLAAANGFGEVNGIGDGLWAWYDLDFEATNRLLKEIDRRDLKPEEQHAAGLALKSALSLFLAQRRPSDYLVANRNSLEKLANSHLRVMAQEGVIPLDIRDIALSTRLVFNVKPSLSYSMGTTARKAANLIRSKLLSHLEVKRLYDLDRIDLSVKTTIDLDLQRKVAERLISLKDPLTVNKSGLKAPYLLEHGDPAKVIYSFSLYEHTPKGNLLRIQTNNFDGPFSIDDQSKLDLGSSAKLRTLVHYLEIIKQVHDEFATIETPELKQIFEKHSFDPLTRWVFDYLIEGRDRNLSALLNAAMERMYSASPYERFFTGGGLHTFSNFKSEDNHKIMTVREAFQQSVNLVFVRLMRDISFYHVFQRYGVTPLMIQKLDESKKKTLLTTFADKEGTLFVKRFYNKHHPIEGPEIRQRLFSEVHPTPRRLAAAFRYLDPSAPPEEFADCINEYLPSSKLSESFIIKLYDDYDPDAFSLADIGYLTSIHPLELWVARSLYENPKMTLPEILKESADERQEVYKWLFKTKNLYRQYQRIRSIIEIESFQDILFAWKRLGYPFDYLVPSYATSIGSSADRPGALAELVGIIQNNGIRFPLVRMDTLHFAKGSPYETLLSLAPCAGEQVIAPEIAHVVKQALVEVVEKGTARRLHHSLQLSDGAFLAIGGKTGTGDHRYKTFGPGGIIIKSKVMNRSATFVFILGDHFFGIISAFVPGEDAEHYKFSSSLPLAVLQMIITDLGPIFESSEEGVADS